MGSNSAPRHSCTRRPAFASQRSHLNLRLRFFLVPLTDFSRIVTTCLGDIRLPSMSRDLGEVTASAIPPQLLDSAEMPLKLANASRESLEPPNCGMLSCCKDGGRVEHGAAAGHSVLPAHLKRCGLHHDSICSPN